MSQANYDMKITPKNERTATQGSGDFFTGNVTVEMLFGVDEPARSSAAQVSFSAGARTHWHTHPLGQYLIVTEGEGWTQCWGGEKQTITAGDVVHCNCGRKHWHGATADTAMSHIAIQEWQDGTPVTWLEPVTDEQYL